MAEALAVVGAVSAILDLVSFGYQLISVAIDLKDSTGELRVNSERTAIVEDLEVILGNLRPVNNVETITFQSLRQKALILATELKTAINKLKVGSDSTKWKITKVALRNVWDKKKIQELEDRLRGLALELNMHLTVDASHVLNELSLEQRQRLDDLQVTIVEFQTRLSRTLMEESRATRSEIEKQSDQTRISSRNDAMNLETNLTAQFGLLKIATHEIGEQNDQIQEQINVLQIGNERLRAALEDVLEIGNKIELKMNQLERLGSSGSSIFPRALQEGFDMFAQFTFNKTQLKITRDDENLLSTTGHTYRGTSNLTEDAIHVQGDLGKVNQAFASKHLFNDTTNASGGSIKIDGNVTDSAFLPWNRRR